MSVALHHRGPDDSGIWSDRAAGIGFAHTRLSVLDLSAAGHQPMASPSGRFQIIYNGEIYNHSEIREALEAKGISGWRGHSDTETLLAAIEQWGLSETLVRCVGMFALALWDTKNRVLSLARDRLGEKPLYYGWSKGRFLFASELKALRCSEGFEPPIDRQSLDCLLRYANIPAPRSIYQGIFKLLPGTILTLTEADRGTQPEAFDGQTGGLVKSYWSIAKATTASILDLGEAEATLELERLLVRSIQRQSIADVSVGTFLSGGYDSSTIAALQQAHAGSRIETFTIGFDEVGLDEAAHARAVATHLGTSHHEMRVTADDALAAIPDLSRVYDEPFADSSQIPTFLLSKLARQHVTVALSGDGGDELFGGYNRYRAFQRSGKLLEMLPASLRKAASATLRGLGSDRIDRMARRGGVDRFLPQAGIKSEKLARLIDAGGKPETAYEAMVGQWPREARPVRNSGVCTPYRAPHSELDPVSRMMAWDLADYLPNDILVKVDRAAMAASLETRAPFLDHTIVEFALSLPIHMKLAPDGGKAILRQIAYRYIPRHLLDRPKAGFAIPLGQWLRGPLRNWAEDLLSRDKLEEHFDSSAIVKVWNEHLDGRFDRAAALWPILMFEAWRR